MVERDGIAKPIKKQWFSTHSAAGIPLIRSSTLLNMPKEASTVARTPYGERVYQARMHLQTTIGRTVSQRQLAEKVGMGQSALSELEKTGQGSSKTARIAEVTGVRVAWLDRGEGPMLDAPTEPPGEARAVASEQVMHHLVGKPGGTDYRTVALTLAASLEESGVELSVAQFMKLLEATFQKLQR